MRSRLANTPATWGRSSGRGVSRSTKRSKRHNVLQRDSARAGPPVAMPLHSWRNFFTMALGHVLSRHVARKFIGCGKQKTFQGRRIGRKIADRRRSRAAAKKSSRERNPSFAARFAISNIVKPSGTTNSLTYTRPLAIASYTSSAVPDDRKNIRRLPACAASLRGTTLQKRAGCAPRHFVRADWQWRAATRRAEYPRTRRLREIPGTAGTTPGKDIRPPRISKRRENNNARRMSVSRSVLCGAPVADSPAK